MNRYEALKHAVKAHAGQVDKCGQPYILHPIAVAEVFAVRPPDWHLFGEGPATFGHAEVVALLHDVWEDTDYGPIAPLSGEQAAALCLVTHQPGETYADYIEGVCRDQLASVVKLADLWHNMSPARMDCLPAKEAASLLPRYLKARARIWEALGYEWWPEALEGQR